LEGDEELMNFQSAPLNAESALKGNAALQERYGGLLNQLNAARKKKASSKAGQTSKVVVRRGRSKTSIDILDSDELENLKQSELEQREKRMN